MRTHQAAIAALLLAGLAGCATGLTGDTYSRNEARMEQSIRRGTITGLRPVIIEGDETPLGEIGGAALGGIAGSTMGQGRGEAAGAVAGALLGGLLGSVIEKEASKKQGVEITILMSDGKEIAIMQEASPNDQMHVGDHVKLVSNGANTRVTRD